MIDPKPEQAARRMIDAMLAASGWLLADRKDADVTSAPGVAVREFMSVVGPSDYVLFVDGRPVGVLEAKRAGTHLSGVEVQTREYAGKMPKWLTPPLRPLPFLYESTGTETFFTTLLDPSPRARRVFSFHQPDTLRAWLDDALAIQSGLPGAKSAPTFLGRLQKAPPLVTTGLWDVQARAVRNLEQSIASGKPRALVQMATGSGKTFTSISALYRLIKHGDCGRVLFLVDRGNLGRQALKEFQAYTTPDDGRKFTELYNVVNLRSNVIPPVNRVVITTIQRLYSILKGEPDVDDDLEERSNFEGSLLVKEPPPVVYSKLLPPEFFDVVVVDECHRSIYTLWRQVSEYFDATIIGLTATPAKHTFAFFNKNLVMEYGHDQAVRDRVNVPFEVYEIRTEVGTDGGVVAEGETIQRRNRATRELRWEQTDEEVTYTATALDRDVVVPSQIRTVIKEFKDKLFTDIMPGRKDIPKTLFFAKNDDHAEDILRIVREEFGLGNEEAVKVTYKPEKGLGDPTKAPPSKRAEDVIQRFRNSYQPRIAVTVDMIATGTDIKPLEVVVFMRMVKSRGLFEQMIGRGVRVMPDTDFQSVTTDAKVKTHFVVVDAVGVFRAQKTDTQPLDTQKTVSFERLLEMVRFGNRDEEVLAALAARLDRMDRKLTPEQQAVVEAATGGVPLRDMVTTLLDSLDPDVVDPAVREAAAAPFSSPKLGAALLEVRKAQEQTIDVVTVDRVVHSDFSDVGKEIARGVVASFEAFIKEHHDEITALQVLYARPYKDRLRFDDIKALAAAIRQPPHSWTPEQLWAAYETLERDRVKGAGAKRLLTDLVSLVRFALHQDDALVPFADRVDARFENWLAQQGNRGRAFTEEQVVWLRMMRDVVAGSAEITVDDLDGVPFNQHGGLGKGFALFGDNVGDVIEELNRELVA